MSKPFLAIAFAVAIFLTGALAPAREARAATTITLAKIGRAHV